MMLIEKIEKEIQKENITNANIMIYFLDQVVLGKYDGELFFPVTDFKEELCQEIHIFNKDMELRAVGCDQDFEKIVDEGYNYISEGIYVLGSEYKIIDNKYTIAKQYGREIILPFKVEKEQEKQVKIVVHNLVPKNERFISGYRLVDFVYGGK